jgi:hypothetical protein
VVDAGGVGVAPLDAAHDPDRGGLRHGRNLLKVLVRCPR